MKTIIVFLFLFVISLPGFTQTEKSNDISELKIDSLKLVKEKTSQKNIDKIRQKKKSKIKNKRKRSLTSSVNRRFRSLERQKRRQVVGGINPRDQKKIKNKRNTKKLQKRIARRQRLNLPIP
ncbi:hypothetical protein N9N67_02505 [Bacteriovoracaceae bacterium]|nr:hypothetical protein [Bacteriovoracaceae bacterium]